MELETVDDGKAQFSVIAGDGINLMDLAGFRSGAGAPLARVLVRNPWIEAFGASGHERVEAFGIELRGTLGTDNRV